MESTRLELLTGDGAVSVTFTPALDQEQYVELFDIAKQNGDNALILLYGMQSKIYQSLLSQEVWTQQNQEHIALFEIFVITWLHNVVSLPSEPGKVHPQLVNKLLVIAVREQSDGAHDASFPQYRHVVFNTASFFALTSSYSL